MSRPSPLFTVALNPEFPWAVGGEASPVLSPRRPPRACWDPLVPRHSGKMTPLPPAVLHPRAVVPPLRIV